jgi:ABC-type transport system substrate-binding protein
MKQSIQKRRFIWRSMLDWVPLTSREPQTPQASILSNAESSLSSGPYKLKRFQPGVKLILEKNEHAWRR